MTRSQIIKNTQTSIDKIHSLCNLYEQTNETQKLREELISNMLELQDIQLEVFNA